MSKINQLLELIKNHESDEYSVLKELCTDEYFLDYFFKYYPDGVYYIDLHGNVRYYNESAKRILGLNDNKIIDQLNRFLHDTFDLNDEKWFADVMEQPVKMCVNKKDNQSTGPILVEILYMPISLGNELVGVLGLIHDITEFKLTKDQLKKNQQQLLTIYENVDSVLWSVDTKNQTMVYISTSIIDLIGVSAEVYKERHLNWQDFIHPDDVDHYRKQQPMLLNGQKVKHEYRVIHINGDVRWVQDYTIPILNEDGELFRLDGVIVDITEQKVLEEKKTRLIYYDHLTELPNKRYLIEKIDELVEAENPFSLIYLDLDRFKYLNDTLGHTIGDRLLQAFSVRVASVIQEQDLLARIGGDVFAIVVRDSDRNNVQYVERVLRVLKSPFHIEKFELFVSISIGITCYPTDGKNSHKLLSNAQMALSMAKDLGNNSYQIYTPTMKGELENEFKLESDLRRALVQNELFVEFQPRVDVITNEIVSAEALVRWEHPEYGRILPGLFIPLAEKSGLVSDIGEWVLNHVCEQLKTWIKDGSHLVVPISVNLSAQTFMRRNWERTLCSLLDQNQIPPHLIEFEITESTIIKNEEIMSEALEYLHEKGIKVALDDFGIGFSSLSYLKKFEIDTLKIDKSFIQGIQHKKDIAIIRCIIQLAKELNIRVVGEGIETEEHLTMLKELECDEIQGFYFSKPVKHEQFRELLRKRVL